MRNRKSVESKMADNSDFEIDADSDQESMEVESSEHPSADEIERLLREADISDIPDTLIVTNVDISVFENDNSKREFEQTFCVYDENTTFQYFKSFRRARVNCSSPLFAANARIDLHEAEVCGQRIKCFFFQPISMSTDDDPYLKLPAPQKQFLISPPASPPVGWEQNLENKPIINYDLLAAIAQLTPEMSQFACHGGKQQVLSPTRDVVKELSFEMKNIPKVSWIDGKGQAHELHPQSKDQPGIVVHVCEDPEGYAPGGPRPQLGQTRCPDRST